jgi:hypothetical protein
MTTTQRQILAPKRNRLARTARALCATVLLAVSALAGASTLLRVSVDELTQRAEFVFEGEVVSVQAQRSGARGMISTFVTFNVIDTIKGSASVESIELKFLGGNLEGERLEVNGSRIPELGERGVYFVESLTQDLINPLLGWSQGQYLIQTEDGVEQVTSVNARPIVSVAAPRSAAAAAPGPATARSAARLRVAAEPTVAEGLNAGVRGSDEGLSPRAFKQQIRALLP